MKRWLFLFFFLVAGVLMQAVVCPHSYAAGGMGAVDQTYLKNVTEGFLTSSGLKAAAQEAGQLQQEVAGKGLPVLREVTDPFAAGAESRVKAALEQATSAARIVNMISRTAATSFFNQLANNPLFISVPDINFSYSLPQVGQVTLRKSGGQVAVYISNTAPGGVSVVLGISNMDPLCSLNAGRMGNKSRTATAFLDLAVQGDSYLQARAPLGGNVPPQITGKSLLKVGDQNIELSFGALDPMKAKMEGSLSVGLKATFDEELSAEAGAEAEITFEVSPAAAAAITAGTAKAMADEARRLNIDLGTKISQDKIVPVIQAGLEYLSRYKSADKDALGKAGFGAEVSAELGAGIGDTKISAVSATGSLSVSVPAENAMNLGAANISQFLEAGLAVAPSFQKLGSAVLTGNPAAIDYLSSQIEQVAAETARQAATNIAGLTREASLELGFSVDCAGEGGSKKPEVSSGKGAGGGGGDRAGTGCKVYEIAAAVPVGKSVDAALAGQSMEQTVKAMAFLVKQMMPPLGSPTAGNISIDWEAAAQAVAEGTTFTITTSPGVPLVNITAELPARSLLAAMEAQNQQVNALLQGLVRGVSQKSLAVLRSSDIASLFSGEGDILADLGKNSTFSISLGGGTSAELGMEATATLGSGASIYAETNPEMLLMLGGGGFNCPGVDGQASIGLDVVHKLDGGVSLGEGVEVTAGSGVKTSYQVLYLNFKEQLPPAVSSVNVAGFTVTGFQGTINADGSFSGSGELQLPYGGSVHAVFSVDAQHHVVTGSWNGELVINNRRFIVTSGTLSDSGLSWTGTESFGVFGTANVTFTLAANGSFSTSGSINVNVAGSQKQFNIGMDSSGNFTAEYTGSLTVGGRNISNAVLTLNNSGISGTGRINLAGSQQTFNLNVGNYGQVTGTYQGTVTVGGRQVTGTFSLASDGTITCSSGVQATVGGSARNFLVTVDSQGNVTGTYSGSLTVGGRNISNAVLTLNNSGISGTGRVAILGSQINFSLAVDSAGQLSGSASDVTLNANLPGGKSVSITSSSLSLSSDGKISGTGTVKAGNKSITEASITVNTNGSVTGSGSLSIGGGSISCTYSLSASSFSVSGSTSITKSIPGFTFNCTVSLGVKNTNEIQATASGKVNGTSVASASVNLGSGEVTVKLGLLSLTFDLF